MYHINHKRIARQNKQEAKNVWQNGNVGEVEHSECMSLQSFSVDSTRHLTKNRNWVSGDN